MSPTQNSWSQRLLFMFLAATGAWITCMVDLMQQADRSTPYKVSQLFSRYLLPEVSEPVALWISLGSIGLAGALLVFIHDPAKKLDAFSWGLSVFAALGVGANPSEELHGRAALDLSPVSVAYAQAEPSSFSLVWGQSALEGTGKLKIWDAQGTLVRELNLESQTLALELAPGTYRLEMRAPGRRSVRFELSHQPGPLGYYIPAEPSEQSAWLQLFSRRLEPKPVPIETPADLERLLSQ